MYWKQGLALIGAGFLASSSFAAITPFPNPTPVPCATEAQNLSIAAQAAQKSFWIRFDAEKRLENLQMELNTLQSLNQMPMISTLNFAQINNLTQEIVQLQGEIPQLEQNENSDDAAQASAEVAYQSCMDFLPTLP